MTQTTPTPDAMRAALHTVLAAMLADVARALTVTARDTRNAQIGAVADAMHRAHARAAAARGLGDVATDDGLAAMLADIVDGLADARHAIRGRHGDTLRAAIDAANIVRAILPATDADDVDALAVILSVAADVSMTARDGHTPTAPAPVDIDEMRDGLRYAQPPQIIFTAPRKR